MSVPYSMYITPASAGDVQVLKLQSVNETEPVVVDVKKKTPPDEGDVQEVNVVPEREKLCWSEGNRMIEPLPVSFVMFAKTVLVKLRDPEEVSSE